MASPLYIFWHIPKTAGSTLNANFYLNFKKGERLCLDIKNRVLESGALYQAVDREIALHKTPHTRCVYGHWAYMGVHLKIRPEATPHYITFLREPVERCASLYGYVLSQPGNIYHRALVESGWSLGEWLERGDILGLHNGQVRRLLFDGTSDVMMEPDLGREHLEIAKARLRQFWFVGLTESFDFDALYLYGKLKFRRFHHQRRVNVTPNKPAVSPREREALARANVLDTELFEFACQLHRDWRLQNAAEIHREQRRARILAED